MKPSDLRKGTILADNKLEIRSVRDARVAVLIPSRGTWTAHTGVAVTSLVSTSVLMGMGVMVNAENNSVITQARNKLARLALGQGADYALWIDSDMKFPADALYRLIQHGRDMVCAFYNQRLPPHRTIGHIIGDKFDTSKGGLYEADYAGMGFMLTKMEVFKATQPPWFFETYEEKHKGPENPDGMVGEDSNFLRKTRAAGFKLWVDLDLTFEMGHVGDNIIPCLKPPPQQNSSPSPAETTPA